MNGVRVLLPVLALLCFAGWGALLMLDVPSVRLARVLSGVAVTAFALALIFPADGLVAG